MKARAPLVTIATLALLATGCGTGASTRSDEHGAAGHADHDMSGMTMKDMASEDGPSKPARMICGDEIRGAVQRTFALDREPASSHRWADATRRFSCTYRLPDQASLRLSVQDSPDEKAGRRYYEALRGRLPGATPVRGMENFGFPAFETPSGNVVFLKDGKTLRVDASALPGATLPDGFSRQEAAYSVASAVVACWTE